MGRKDDALRMIESALSEVTVEKDFADHGDYYNKEIEINFIWGNTSKALSMIERSSNIYGGISYNNLLHPKWDSIREHSQFKKILSNLNPNL